MGTKNAAGEASPATHLYSQSLRLVKINLLRAQSISIATQPVLNLGFF